MTRTKRILGVLGGLGLVAALMTAVPVSTALAKDSPVKRAAKGELRASQIQTSSGKRVLPALSASTVNSAREVMQQQSAEGDGGGQPGLGAARNSLGCSARNTDGNVRVNQDCTYRRQAEELIKYNPANPSNLIAGQNDSRVGYNKCGFDYSFDGGRTWGDGQPPFYQKLNNPAGQEPTATDPNRHTIAGGAGTGHTYDAGSDPALAFDSQGRAFFSCVTFDVNSNASGVFVTQSPAYAGGSFYNNLSAGSRRYVVAEDNSETVFHDKQFIVADAISNGPNRDNVYITWTVFKFDPRCGSGPNPDGVARYCESPIFGSMSTDHATHWSTPEQISGSAVGLCFLGTVGNPTGKPSSCNFDQGSDPIVLPNGDLEVIFNNGNTAQGNPNAQQLGVHCKPSGSSPAGTAHLNCTTPSKVGNDVIAGEPQCDFGRGPEECIPGAYIRTNDFPRIAVNRGNGALYGTWQDYRNQEFDIQLSASYDGGLTWHEAAAPVNPDRGTDHYFPAIDVVCSGGGSDSHACQGGEGSGGEGSAGGNGEQQLCAGSGGESPSSSKGGTPAANDHVGVSYYRTCRVPNENSTPVFSPGKIPAGSDDGREPVTSPPGNASPGVQHANSDYRLSGGRGLRTPYAERGLSPIFPPPDGNQVGFNGDYSGLVIVGNTAHPIWSDTRNAVPADQTALQSGLTHDEDIWTDAVGLPDKSQD